jgi:hypothetical protein
MSKKDLTGGLNSLLGDKLASPRRGRPVTQTKEVTKSSHEGTKENETRAPFIKNKDLLEKLKAIAYWDSVLIKDVLNTTLQAAIERYEKKTEI